MATLEEVQGAVAEAKAAVASVTTDVGNVVTKIGDLQAQIAAGTAVTAADLDGLLDGVRGITAGMKDADTAFDAVAPDAAPEE